LYNYGAEAWNLRMMWNKEKEMSACIAGQITCQISEASLGWDIKNLKP